MTRKKFKNEQLALTLPETNIAPENRPSQKEGLVFQPSIFRCELLVSGRVGMNIADFFLLLGEH